MSGIDYAEDGDRFAEIHYDMFRDYEQASRRLLLIIHVAGQ